MGGSGTGTGTGSRDLGAWLRSVAAGVGPEPGPAPGGEALRLTVRCTTSPDPAGPATRHPVRIRPDWTIETPHDLDAERLAVALGGHLSCLSLVDSVVPAVRRAMRLLARRTLPPLVWDAGPGRWRPARRVRGCCGSRGRDLAEVAAHLRGPDHVAAAAKADPRAVRAVMRGVLRAHGGAEDLVPPERELAEAAARCTRGCLDAVALWDAGLHPAVVVAVHDAVGAGGRLPARFYLGAVTRRPDLAWVAATLAAARESGADAAEPPMTALESGWITIDAPAEPLASWLVWSATDADRLDPTVRSRWLAAGVTRRLVLALSEAGYPPEDVAALAAGWRRDADGAARSLASWVAAGARPDVADLLLLERRGVPSYAAPSAAAVARLRGLAAGSAFGVDDTELALLIAAAGTVPHAAAALRAGDAQWRAAAWQPPSRDLGGASRAMVGRGHGPARRGA